MTAVYFSFRARGCGRLSAGLGVKRTAGSACCERGGSRQEWGSLGGREWGSSRGAPRSYTGLKRALVATRESCIPLWKIIGAGGARGVDVYIKRETDKRRVILTYTECLLMMLEATRWGMAGGRVSLFQTSQLSTSKQRPQILF